jgi:hypothetical protein
MTKVAWGFMALATATSCVHPKVKFQKAMLLDPLMDPAKDLPLLDSTLAGPARTVEKASASPGSPAGATCPTCGG